jgi:DNA-binding beta-propeller fold protein YncE
MYFLAAPALGIASLPRHSPPKVEVLSTETRNPYGLVIGPDGALYVCEIDRHVVSQLDLQTRQLTVVAGTAGRAGYAGDGGVATSALLNEPYEVRFDRRGDLYFVEMKNHVVRRVDCKTGMISTVAGIGGEAGFSGDGGPAREARFRQPHSIAFDRDGALLVCDIGNHRLRRVDLKSGTITTLAGSGGREAITEGAPFDVSTPLNGPRAIDLDAKGNLFLVLREGNQVYRVDRRTRKLELLAGTGIKGWTGDGGDARRADLNGPKGVAWSREGAIYLADTESHTIRRVDLATRRISTLLGNGVRGETARPHGVFAGPTGEVYVGDSENDRVLLIR